MRTVENGQYGICDFCGDDETGSRVKWVKPIGDKGICNRCVFQLIGIIQSLKPPVI